MTFVTAQGLCFYILFAPIWAVYVPQWRASVTLSEFVIFATNGSVTEHNLQIIRTQPLQGAWE